MKLYDLTIHELHEKLKDREVSSVEATNAVLKRIEEVEDSVKAFVTVIKDNALEQACEADRKLAAGEGITALTGVPLAVKDIFCIKGIETTCASKILKGFVPPYDATVVKKLKDAGAVIIGKNNMDEFAMGSSTENSAFHTTKNPWDSGRIPGGSSGGSAAAVAASECFGSIGTDTGGSIRQPAALCGVVGLKPTYGRVSRYGMIAFASSLDQGGPLTKDVTDSAILLNIMAGHDPLDSTSINSPVPDYTKVLDMEVKGLKIGLPKEYFIDGTDSEVEQAVREAANILEKEGAEIIEVSLPHTEYAVAVYYLVATAEASSNLARYDGVKFGYRTKNAEGLMDMYYRTRDEGFGAEVKRRIMLGTYALSSGYYDAYYKKACQVRNLIKMDFDDAFNVCDVILTPTTPTPAFKVGEKAENPLQMYLSDIFTISCNLAGIPGISIPCGFNKEGLPIGMQLLGKTMDEVTILKTAAAYQRVTVWHSMRPAI
ncbi:MAG: Asp-tRNA(Asn)/Glu-tRNA(Gln) amidotransferase subunit GatA [Thermodesulfobacteriota bacterium]